MDFLRPASLDEALAMKSADPAAVPIAGGTDVMVEINFDARRPGALVDLTRVAELAAWSRDGGLIRIGAGVSYVRLIGELGALLRSAATSAPPPRPVTAIRCCWRPGRSSRPRRCAAGG
jgi:CO/xanthine dehydrogenase FAD-binding subunit